MSDVEKTSMGGFRVSGLSKTLQDVGLLSASLLLARSTIGASIAAARVSNDATVDNGGVPRAKGTGAIAKTREASHVEPPIARKIEVEFCHAWSFRPKAEWFGARLLERVEALRAAGLACEAAATPIGTRGKMFVRVDGRQVYSKGGFNATNPQPTPAEVEILMESLTRAAGREMPLTDEEKAEFAALHKAQIRAGRSKH